MDNINRYTPTLILFLTILIGIAYRSPVFFLLGLIILGLLVYKGFLPLPKLLSKLLKREIQGAEIRIEDGILITRGRTIGVVIVEEIPFDYRDLGDSSLRSTINSFHKVLNLGTQIDMVLRRKHIDKRTYLNSILNKIQNLRVVMENDPSNAKAKRELEVLQTVLEKINSGETPFVYQFFLLVYGKNVEEVKGLSNIVIRGLESLNMRSRLASSVEIRDLLVLSPSTGGKTGLPSQIPFMTPFAVTKLPKSTLWGEGVYMGKEIEKGFPVFWNVKDMENPHLLVIGPTGSGKTEFLLKEGVLLSLLYQLPTVFFDSKGDIRNRLLKYGLKPKVLNPLFYSVNILNASEVPTQLKPLFIERIISSSFGLSKIESAVLFNSLSEVLRKSNGGRVTWGSLLSELINNDNDVKNVIEKVTKVVMELDHDGPPLLDSIIEGINVIDLSQIKEENLRRLVMYSVISSLYARFSRTVDEGLRAVLVIDEAWTILREEVEWGIVVDLIKRGRGHGIALLMATQNVQDMGGNFDIFMENVGVLCFMNNGDRKYWTEVVRRYASLIDSEVDTKLSFMNRGEMLVRFLGDPRPLVIKTEPLV